MMTFNDFVRKHDLKNKATSNLKRYEVLKNLRLDTKVGIYLRDGSFSSDIGIVNLHPSRGSHWVLYIKDCYFDSYGCPPPKKLLNYLKKNIKNVFILNIKYKKMIVFVQTIVYI